ncbi:uncharacterized protein VICG_01170 [Vittaforma corneae ATCC 50505]|uniref:Uncharacterized protein n=1 Tax=Vittaforma corneae (strain ATCC 50505) TaxID=993615 RepID=L2GLQ2_VITCO|nr:uncharacterized protein VICG_01170 [Vittaforma corneae ATCC 50505]ELA41818.1 hypothetical protein VICG_01170 [Vittaforma corneae ATCC 50505]
MTVPRYICSEIDLPLCKTLGIEQTVYNAFSTTILGLQINSPYSLALLLISVVCANRMISHVDSLYSSIGRGEMKTFFYLYMISNSLLVCTLCFDKLLGDDGLKFLNVLQAAFQSTMFFSLFTGGMTIDKIYGVFGMKSASVMQILSTIYFVMISTFIYIFVAIKNRELITILVSIETGCIVLYLGSQIKNLRKSNGEIWGYGVLWVIFMFFVMSKIHTVLCANLVARLSERSLDNMFFNICYTFLVVMMCHKFWLSTYDFELECLALNV